MSPVSRWLKPYAVRPVTVSMAVLLSLTASLPLRAQEQLLRTLSVTGQGVENIQTTLATVRLGVEVQGASAESVQAQVAQRSNAVVKLLESRKVDKLQTMGIRLNAEYRYNEGRKRQLVGYQGSNIVSFQTGIEKAGPLMDAAVKAGASRIDGVSFMASEDAIATAQTAALQDATQKAQAQAKAVLESLGFTPKEIVGIQVNGASARPIPRARAVSLEAQDASQPLIGGEQAVRSSVTLQISY